MPKSIGLLCATVHVIGFAAAQGREGILRGVVLDASGAPAPSARIEISGRSTRYSAQIRSGTDGLFTIPNVPAGSYIVRVTLSGFAARDLEVTIHQGVCSEISVRLELASQQSSVTVKAGLENVIDGSAAAVQVVDRERLSSLPALSPDSGLNDAIVYTAPGVVADSNGFFHPSGDHAQVSYVLDGQPISDQRNKVFSTSIPLNAIQTMDVISGSPAAEYGDKTSLVINATTRSGLGQKPSGSFLAKYGSFGTVGEEATFGTGGARWGNFLAANSERTGRFLDSPEFWPMHDAGNTATIFDRFDFQRGAKDAVHLNVMAARNWMQVPNTYDQARQDQRHKVISFNVAPGLEHSFDARTLATVNAFFRRDRVRYFPSRNPFDDSPATVAQDRSLSNLGIHASVSGAQGRHGWKAGLTATRTRLEEAFSLGITDPAYNAPCTGEALAMNDPSQCTAAGFQPNPDFVQALAAFDLSRGGRMYEFHGSAAIRQLALFGQHSMTLGDVTVTIGIRFDRYRGLTSGDAVQPRGAFSYLLRRTSTVIRAGFSRTMETPTNENLVVSSSTGSGGLASNLLGGAAEQRAIGVGTRNQYDAGIGQAIGRWLIVDVNYFRKYTRNAFDFDALFSTPIAFPIGWRRSKLDGVSGRISTAKIRGLRVFATMGHANARFFGPENGGIIFNSALTGGVFRQDHDQVYQQNVNVRYQRPHNGWHVDFTWRYDSGLVVGAVNTLEDALSLTADQQSMIGFYCGGERASLSHPITHCDSAQYGATRIGIPAPGTANPDHNPPRTRSRHIFSIGAGTDNLFRTERFRTILRFTVANLTNEAALYNFLSPFGGTHWAPPRMYEVRAGWAFYARGFDEGRE
jgi:hypothetical protein